MYIRLCFLCMPYFVGLLQTCQHVKIRMACRVCRYRSIWRLSLTLDTAYIDRQLTNRINIVFSSRRIFLTYILIILLDFITKAITFYKPCAVDLHMPASLRSVVLKLYTRIIGYTLLNGKCFYYFLNKYYSVTS